MSLNMQIHRDGAARTDIPWDEPYIGSTLATLLEADGAVTPGWPDSHTFSRTWTVGDTPDDPTAWTVAAGDTIHIWRN